MQTSSPAEKRLFLCCNVLFGLSLIIGSIFILHLPLFPSSDGPIHIYYANVLWSLATHQPQYQHYYAIRHLVGTYSIHYFALILFERFLSSAKAEELLIVLVLLNTAIGFRFLAARLGKNSPVASLWMIPLLLSWPVGGGFFNYCIAIGMTFWVIAFWINLPPVGSARALAGFVVALLVLVFSHPVPLLFLCPFFGADTAILFFEARGAAVGSRLRSLALRILALCLTCLAILIPAMTTEKSKMGSVWRNVRPYRWALEEFIQGNRLSMFSGAHPFELLHAAGNLIIVPGVLFLMAGAVWMRLRSRTTSTADRLLLFTICYVAATLTFPLSVNGLTFIPERFWSLLWPLVLACSSAAALQLKTLRWLAAAGTLLILVFGIVAHSSLTHMARRQAEMAALRMPQGSKGIFLQPNYPPPGVTYETFYWSGARPIAESGAVLLNGPWLRLPHIPVKGNGHAGLVDDLFPPRPGEWEPRITTDPPRLLITMEGSSPARNTILRTADFLLYSDPAGDERHLPESVHTILRDQQGQWSCKYGSYFALCEKN